MEEEYTNLLREGTDRQQLGAAVGGAQMDSNNSPPSWDQASERDRAGVKETGPKDHKNNSSLEWEDKESSFAEESDASSIIVRTVKRKPKHAPKISSTTS